MRPAGALDEGRLAFEFKQLRMIPAQLGGVGLDVEPCCQFVLEIKPAPDLDLEAPVTFDVHLDVAGFPGQPPRCHCNAPLDHLPPRVQRSQVVDPMGSVRLPLLDARSGWSRSYSSAVVFYALRRLFHRGDPRLGCRGPPPPRDARRLRGDRRPDGHPNRQNIYHNCKQHLRFGSSGLQLGLPLSQQNSAESDNVHCHATTARQTDPPRPTSGRRIRLSPARRREPAAAPPRPRHGRSKTILDDGALPSPPRLPKSPGATPSGAASRAHPRRARGPTRPAPASPEARLRARAAPPRPLPPARLPRSPPSRPRRDPRPRAVGRL